MELVASLPVVIDVIIDTFSAQRVSTWKAKNVKWLRPSRNTDIGYDHSHTGLPDDSYTHFAGVLILCRGFIAFDFLLSGVQFFENVGKSFSIVSLLQDGEPTVTEPQQYHLPVMQISLESLL